MSELAISIAVNCALGIILLGVLRWKLAADTVRLTSGEEAMDQVARQFPGAVGVATLADDGRSALFELQRGGAGLLQRQGRRWNARTLKSGEVSSVQVARDGTIKTRFADFSWPQAQIRIADENARGLWLDRLRSLQAQKPTRHQPGLHEA
jgi:hypothetical protein